MSDKLEQLKRLYKKNVNIIVSLQKIKSYSEIGRWIKSYDVTEDIELIKEIDRLQSEPEEFCEWYRWDDPRKEQGCNGLKYNIYENRFPTFCGDCGKKIKDIKDCKGS